MTGSTPKGDSQHTPQPFPKEADGQKAESEEQRRRRFAKSLTRNLFGRHYWNDALEAEKQKAAKKKHK